MPLITRRSSTRSFGHAPRKRLTAATSHDDDALVATPESHLYRGCWLVRGPANTISSAHFYSGCGFMFRRPFLGIPSLALSTLRHAVRQVQPTFCQGN